MAVKLRGRDAFSYAFNEYMDTVYRVAYHNTQSEADAQDITQETFMKLLDDSRSFKDAEHLKAWLIRVTINLCHNLYRSSKKTVQLDESLAMPENIQAESVLDYVRVLPENYKNAIYLHYYEGYTAEEIGGILGAKTNTVLSWLSRGREILRRQMTGGFDGE